MSTRNHIRSMLAITAMSFLGAVSAAELAPDAQVKSTTQEVLEVIGRTSDQRSLEDLAESKVVPHFDFQRMSRLALGRAWSQATPAQQEALGREFQRLLVRVYTRALAAAGPSKAGVEVQPARKHTSANQVLVKTKITRSGHAPIAIDYRMENTPSGWKVYDVAVENVSLVLSYRGSFKAEIDKSGIDGLIRSLAEKNRAGDAKTG